MTRRTKLVVAALLAVLMVASQTSWLLLSRSALAEAGVELAASRLLLAAATLAFVDLVVLGVALLLVRASLGRKRFALALLVAAVPLVARLAVSARSEARRKDELAKVRARETAERARLAREKRPTVGAPREGDAAEVLRDLAATPAEERLGRIAPEMREAAAAGPPLRLRVRRALDDRKAVLEALHGGAACARCDGALLESVEGARLEPLVAFVLCEGHRHFERGDLEAARESYLVALRVATDLASARTGALLDAGRSLEALALAALFRLATAEAPRLHDLDGLAKELERFEAAVSSPSNAGELEALESLEAYLLAPELDGSFFPWDEQDLARAHVFWFLPSACAVVHELPRAEKLVHLGAEWARTADPKAREEIEARARDLERSCAAPACSAALLAKSSARWDDLAALRLVRAAALAEARRGGDGRAPETLGAVAPEDPFAPGRSVRYERSVDERGYRLVSAGLTKPLVAREPAPEKRTAPTAPAPLPAGAIARVASISKGVLGAIAFTPDGANLLVVQRGVHFVSLATGAAIARLPAPDAFDLAVDASRRAVVVFEKHSFASRWDLETRTERDDLDGGARGMRTFAISRDGALLAVAPYGDGPIRLHAPDGRLVREIGAAPRGPQALGLSPDGSLLALATARGAPLLLFDTASGASVGAIEPGCAAQVLAFSPDGRRLAAVVGKEVRLADVATRRPIGVLPTPAAVARAAWSPDGRLIATVGQEPVAHIFDVARLEEVAAFRPDPPAWPRSLAFSPDGTRLATADGDGVIIIWDLSSHRK